MSKYVIAAAVVAGLAAVLMAGPDGPGAIATASPVAAEFQDSHPSATGHVIRNTSQPLPCDDAGTPVLFRAGPDRLVVAVDPAQGTVTCSQHWFIPKHSRNPSRWYEADNTSLGGRLQPGTCFTVQSERRGVRTPVYDVCTNSHGFRGPAYEDTPPDGVHRIIALGDYITFGVVDQNDTWPAQLEARLNAQESGSQQYQVLNMGFPRWNTRKEVRFLAGPGSDLLPSTGTVVLQFMTNDAQDLSYIQSRADMYHADGHNWSTANRMAVEDERQRRGQLPVSEQLADVTPALARLEDLSQRHGFDVVVLEYSSPHGDPYHERIQDLARQYGWTTTSIDLPAAQAQQEDNGPQLVFPRSWEPTPAGNRMIAGTVQQALRSTGQVVQ